MSIHYVVSTRLGSGNTLVNKMDSTFPMEGLV